MFWFTAFENHGNYVTPIPFAPFDNTIIILGLYDAIVGIFIKH